MLKGKGEIIQIAKDCLIVKCEKDLQGFSTISKRYKINIRITEKKRLNDDNVKVGDIIEFKAVISTHFLEAALKPIEKIFLVDYRLFEVGIIRDRTEDLYHEVNEREWNKKLARS